MHPSQASRVQSAAPVTHYENFPVASVLCPAHLRPAVAAIYHFARTGDDLADEGDASRDERLRALTTYRSAYHRRSDDSRLELRRLTG